MIDLLIDLDNTVYSENAKIFSQVDLKMKNYISKYLKINLEEAFVLQKSYFKKYGTTLRGLMLNHNIKPGPYLEFVHDIELSSIKKNPALENVLTKYSGKKIIFTNGTKKHAENVLSKVGIENCINGIFDIKDAEYIPKPNISTYEKVLINYGLNPVNTAMIDDIPINLKTAKKLGLYTILIKYNFKFDVYYDYVDNITLDLKESITELNNKENVNEDRKT